MDSHDVNATEIALPHLPHSIELTIERISTGGSRLKWPPRAYWREAYALWQTSDSSYDFRQTKAFKVTSPEIDSALGIGDSIEIAVNRFLHSVAGTAPVDRNTQLLLTRAGGANLVMAWECNIRGPAHSLTRHDAQFAKDQLQSFQEAAIAPVAACEWIAATASPAAARRAIDLGLTPTQFMAVQSSLESSPCGLPKDYDEDYSSRWIEPTAAIRFPLTVTIRQTQDKCDGMGFIANARRWGKLCGSGEGPADSILDLLMTVYSKQKINKDSEQVFLRANLGQDVIDAWNRHVNARRMPIPFVRQNPTEAIEHLHEYLNEGFSADVACRYINVGLSTPAAKRLHEAGLDPEAAQTFIDIFGDFWESHWRDEYITIVAVNSDELADWVLSGVDAETAKRLRNLRIAPSDGAAWLKLFAEHNVADTDIEIIIKSGMSRDDFVEWHRQNTDPLTSITDAARVMVALQSLRIASPSEPSPAW
ncbi:hypothetical protein [Nocardioides sp.]|uniref:hypothetical protein n=1 Tax=Nocardioides sp. TaxID=35761 RepID=UPI00351756A8